MVGQEVLAMVAKWQKRMALTMLDQAERQLRKDLVVVVMKQRLAERRTRSAQDALARSNYIDLLLIRMELALRRWSC
jgi:hypothetical protein